MRFALGVFWRKTLTFKDMRKNVTQLPTTLSINLYFSNQIVRQKSNNMSGLYYFTYDDNIMMCNTF